MPAYRQNLDFVGEGNRNTYLTSICGLLVRKDIDAYLIEKLLIAFNLHYCRPPISQGEVESIIDSICELHLKKGANSNDN